VLAYLFVQLEGEMCCHSIAMSDFLLLFLETEIYLPCHFVSFTTCMPMLILIYVAARLETAVVDIGPPANWVKVNVQKTVSA
jgi:hypothetical protein